LQSIDATFFLILSLLFMSIYKLMDVMFLQHIIGIQPRHMHWWGIVWILSPYDET